MSFLTYFGNDVCIPTRSPTSTYVRFERWLANPPNPGGALPPEHILGRDALVGELWRNVETQSVALFSPRRVGKTSLLERMKSMAPSGWIVRKRDLEGLHTAEAFARYLYEDVGGLVGGTKGALKRAHAFLQGFAGSVEIKGIKLKLPEDSWRRLIESLFADLQEHLKSEGKRLVFFWDEFTLFLGDVAARSSATDAMVLLDTLRAARQRHDRLRMVLTGSVGFHLVMRQLAKVGYRNRPINDVRTQRVPMLDQRAREALARALLLGIDATPTDSIVERIGRLSEGHPFVLQHIVDGLRGDSTVDEASINSVFEGLLSPPTVLDLGHYASRLKKYYDDAAKLAFSVLDALAVSDGGLTLDELAGEPGTDREDLVDVLRDLRDDDYVAVEGTNVRFSLDFVRRYWANDRMLG